MMLSDVCLSVAYIGLKSRTERPGNWYRGSPRHTWLGHHFQGKKVKGQGHQAALLIAALRRQAAVAVTVETYWPWEPTATLRSAGAVGSAARGASALTKGEGRGILWRPPAYSLLEGVEKKKKMMMMMKNLFFAQKPNIKMNKHVNKVRKATGRTEAITAGRQQNKQQYLRVSGLSVSQKSYVDLERIFVSDSRYTEAVLANHRNSADV